MSLASQLQSVFTRVGTEFKTVKTHYSGNASGDLSGLNTTSKSSLLAAINEVNTLALGKQQNLGFTPENAANKGAANGYASLDSGGKVPISQLPSVLNSNKGYFATQAALTTAYPTASAGDYAIVGSTDTVWIWDTDGTPAWEDSDQKGAVTSVNGMTGAVTIANATTGAAGLMSSGDKSKLDGIASGATANSSDATLLARANHTGTQTADTITDGTNNKVFTASEKTKLGGIAAGATANDTDANLKSRANHTGTQSADTLTDGTTNKAFLATERTKLAGIAAGATANDTDANLKSRANHTGTQLAATISDFAAAVVATVLTGLSTATNAAISATDSVLAAFGKLQAQINAHFGAGGSAHSAATTSVAGFMSATDKTKLDGIAANANNYSHPSGDGNLHVPANGTTNNGKWLKAGAIAGDISWQYMYWSEVGNKPTTISGYGIADAYTKTEVGDPTTNFVSTFEAALV